MKSNLSILLEKAEQGNVQAMFELGNCYYHGKNGTQQHYVKAMKWFEQVAEDGTNKELTLQACNNLVSYYLKGNVEIAEKWAKRASEFDSIEGLKKVAQYLCKGKDFEEESVMKKKGITYLIELAKKGDRDAIRYLPEYVFNYERTLGEDEILPNTIKQFMDNEYPEIAKEYKVNPYKSAKRSFWEFIGKVAIVISVLVFLLFVAITIFPTVVIIENGKNYQKETVFDFSMEFKDSKNKIHKIEGLSLFSNYVYNASENTYDGYVVEYKPKKLSLIATTISSFFTDSKHSSRHYYYVDKTSIKQTPEYIIAPNELIKVEDIPKEVYFHKAPQSVEYYSRRISSSIDVWVLRLHR